MGGQEGNNIKPKIQIQLKERESHTKKAQPTELCSKKEFTLEKLPRYLYMHERKPKYKHRKKQCN